MNTNLNAWLKNSVNIREYGNTRSQELRKQLVCNDGTTLSVQASDTHWCSPRRSYVDYYTDDIEYFDYSSVEVWCVSTDVPDSWSDYGDDDNPYAYIPVTLVEKFIDSHGGIKE